MSSESSNSPRSDPEAQRVLALIDGFRSSKAVFTAVSLGVFDRLHRRPATCAELADALSVQKRELERLLGACVGLDFLRIEGERYHNKPASSRFLRVGSPEDPVRLHSLFRPHTLPPVEPARRRRPGGRASLGARVWCEERTVRILLRHRAGQDHLFSRHARGRPTQLTCNGHCLRPEPLPSSRRCGGRYGPSGDRGLPPLSRPAGDRVRPV